MKKTPLHEEHLRLKGRMVAFGGFDMPVQYSGVKAEHMAVRTKAGLFDVSHMGEVEVAGPKAFDFVQHITCNDVSRLKVGRAHYTAMLTERGTFVDDLLVYRLAEDHFFLVVNASNTDKDYAWMLAHNPMEAPVINRSADYAQIAVQGPLAQEILQTFAPIDLDTIKFYRFKQMDLLGFPCIVSRTGYTGEDGFEIYVEPEGAVPIWRKLLSIGEPKGLVPCGLGARDTLRLESCMMLYGNDIDDEHTPWEAKLDWIVKMDKGDFVGHEPLVKQKEKGIERVITGFEMIDRGIARHGYPVVDGDTTVGVVTSGTVLPFFNKAMGLAYVPAAMDVEGGEITIDVRGRVLKARIIPTPFYKRPKK